MTQPPAPKVRVLLAEDSSAVALHFKEALEQQGYQVGGPVASAEQGVALVSSTDVDIAILDVRLRDSDSFPIAAALQEGGCAFHFVTGCGEPPLSEGDVTDIPMLRKPFDGSDLHQRIQQLLQRAG